MATKSVMRSRIRLFTTRWNGRTPGSSESMAPLRSGSTTQTV